LKFEFMKFTAETFVFSAIK